MPYPFAPMPTLGEFINRAISAGCELRTMTGLIGPRGDATVRYLVRKVGNVYRVLPLPGLSDDERLTPSTLESYELTLNIEPQFPTLQ